MPELTAGRGRAAAADDFADYVAARGPGLLRLAFVLTGSAADAEDVVQDALSRAYPRWSRVSAAEDVDAYVRRMVVNAHVSWWRRFRRRESPVETVPDRHQSTGADAAENAALTDCAEPTARSRVFRGLSALRDLLGEES